MRRRREAYLGPIDFKVGEADVFEACEDGEHVGVFVEVAQVGAVVIEVAGLVPAFGDAGIVLPVVEHLQVFRIFVVEGDHGEVLVEGWDVTAVDNGARLGLCCASWVETVHTCLGELRCHFVVGGCDVG